MSRASRKARRAAWWEERKVRVAIRRAKFWGLYSRYWGVRDEIASDPKIAASIVAVAAAMNPLAGLIVAAAIGIDTKLAPAMQDLANSEEAIALMIIDDMVANGQISEAEGARLAKESIDLIQAPAETSGARSQRRARNYSAIASGPGPRNLLGSTDSAAKADLPTWAIPVAIAIALRLVLR